MLSALMASLYFSNTTSFGGAERFLDPGARSKGERVVRLMRGMRVGEVTDELCELIAAAGEEEARIEVNEDDHDAAGLNTCCNSIVSNRGNKGLRVKDVR